jgi:hypothetical protein
MGNTEIIIKLPIILVDGLDVIIYTSVEQIEQDVEPIDVINNVYTVYDSDGRLLYLDVEVKSCENWMDLLKRIILGPTYKVMLKPAKFEPQHEQELRKVLVEYLVHRGISKELSSETSLKELIDMVLEFQK